MEPKYFFKKNQVFKNQHFLIIMGSLQGVEVDVIVANVYPPQCQALKNSLWTSLLSLINTLDGIWILMGDFNDVRVPKDRMNSQFCELGARKFNEFISMGGRKYTYMTDGGEKLSKIDRILVGPKFMGKWPNASLISLPRELSDHCPLVLLTLICDFGPSPFRFFNNWLMDPNFGDVVREAAASFQFNGPPDKLLSCKLWKINNAIKHWEIKKMEK